MVSALLYLPDDAAPALAAAAVAGRTLAVRAMVPVESVKEIGSEPMVFIGSGGQSWLVG